MKKDLKNLWLIISVAFILIFCFAIYTLAWKEPTAPPPGGNVAAPINTSDISQVKGGKLGIATDGVDPSYGLTVGNSSNNLGIKTTGDSLIENGNLTVGQNVYAQAFFYTSDIKLKKNIKPLSSQEMLHKIQFLQGVKFEWLDNEKSIGLVAQEVEKVFPELVFTNPTTGYKSVNYGILVVPLIEALKEQQKQIEVLHQEIEFLKNHCK